MNRALREKIKKLHEEGKSAEEIARILDKPQQNILYYFREYLGEQRCRIKYDLDVMIVLAKAKETKTLKSARDIYSLTPQVASNIMAVYSRLPKHRAIIEQKGWFNPRRAADCWAVGLAYHHSQKSIAFLRENRLKIEVLDSKPMLIAVGEIGQKRKCVVLTLHEEIRLITDPMKFLSANAARIKRDWMPVRRWKLKKEEHFEPIEVQGVQVL